MKGRGLMDVQGGKSGDKPQNISPHKRISAPKITGPAMKRKAGGAVALKAGGAVAKKGGGAVGGAAPRKNGGRAPRASGGSCDSSPFSSARSGTSPKGRNTSGSIN